MSAAENIAYDQVREIIGRHLDDSSLTLRRRINEPLHANPELNYEEHFAHKTITAFLDEVQPKVDVQRHTYGLETSFEARFGSGGPVVVFCAEYDALPRIGHACGHNLIATSSVAAFLGAAHALAELKIPGRVRLLGTPAEEGGGGKVKLIEAGAFDPPESIAAALMVHPVGIEQVRGDRGDKGMAAVRLVANQRFKVEFHGQSAHSGGQPWDGINALDAAVAGYSNVALLRKQLRLDESVHGIIEDGGASPNIIPGYSRMNWVLRAPTHDRCSRLVERVKKCLEAAAMASGCTTSYIEAIPYRDLRANETLCRVYVEEMAAFGNQVAYEHEKEFNASTDMGNVSYHVPSFHGAFVACNTPGVPIHSPSFTAVAGTDDAHNATMETAKGMAMLAIRVLTEGQVEARARSDFEKSP